VPYTGAGVYSSALAMNKATAKGIWASAGLPTPWWQLLSRDRARALLDKKVGEMGIATPCVIKPATGGSSVGISLVQRLGQLPSALRKALRHPGPVMAEGFIEGRELSVAIMDGHVMGVVEIVPMTTFYDYHAKYGQDSGTEYRLPAPLPSQVHQEVVRVSTEAHRLLQGRGVVRVDLLLDTQDRPWLLELNTVPGMTETSLVPKIAAQTGMSFARFVEMMLNRACLDVEMDHA
ncbi:MAG: ATP-grasp domain-containing protein, partial [Myxococcota bacterium]